MGGLVEEEEKVMGPTVDMGRNRDWPKFMINVLHTQQRT